MSSPMTASSRRTDPLQNQLPHGPYNSDSTIWEWASRPGVIISVLVTLASIAYRIAQHRAASHGRPLPSLGQFIWDAVVSATPAFLLYSLDRWVNPPLFPIPMFQPQPTTHAAKSDVLRRILQVDQGGIVASVSQAGRRAYSNTFSVSKGDSSQPAGLGNWDNSCFQNSILQGLASSKHLPQYLSTPLPTQRLPQKDTDTTAGALRSFISDLNNVSNNGKTLFTPVVLKNMSTIQQQDAQEYFSRLVDQVDKDVEKGARAACKPPGFEADLSKDDSVASQHSDDSGYQSLPMLSKAGSELTAIRNPLEGLSAQRVACTACGYSEGLSMIPFNCLTLNFEVGHSHYDLYELLDGFVRLEAIENVDCVKCTLLEYRKGLQKMAKAIPAALSRLGVVEKMLEEDELDDESLKKLKIPDSKRVSSTKTKQVAIGRPPQTLVMHMNRSVFDPVSFQSYKNLAAVQFPTSLDLGAWCIGSAEGTQKPSSAGAVDGTQRQDDAADKELWVLDATASMVAGDSQPSKISGPFYELRAVVTHYGRHENGHYVCYRKHPRGTTKATGKLETGDSPDQPPNLAGDDELLDDVESINEQPLEDSTPQTPTASTQEPYGRTADSQWWRLSDETVTEVSEQDVLSQGGVFMLFYDCVDPNSVLMTAESSGVKDEVDTALASIVSADSERPECAATPLCDAAKILQQEGNVTEASSVSMPGEGQDGPKPLLCKKLASEDTVSQPEIASA